MKQSPRVIILGGGLTGLAAAWKLAGAGAQVTVVEALDHVGGLAASISWRGFALDIGPHKLYPQAEGVLPILESLLGQDLVKHKKQASVWLRGGPARFPPSLKSGLSHFGLAMASFASYVGSSAARHRRAQISYEDYMVARFGPYLSEQVFHPQAAKLWGPPDQLAAELGRMRMPFASLSEVILGAVVKNRQGPNVNAREFYYPKQGIGELSERLATQITASGSRIILGRKPTAIKLSEDGVEIFLDNDRLAADVVISTIAPDSLLEVIKPLPPSQIRDAASRLRFRSLILCYLALAIPRVSANHWIAFPENRYCFNRIYEAKSFGIQPATGETVIAAEVTVDPDQLWRQPDGEIFDRVVADLETTGLVKTTEVLAYKVIRIKRAYPLLDLGYAAARRQVLAFLHAQPNLLCAGRSGLFIYNNMDHSLRMGLDAADHILRNAIKSWPLAASGFGGCRIID